MSAVERVRETSRLMRERSKVARAGRWYADGSDVLSAWVQPVPITTCDGSAVPEGNRANAEHIASLDPEVARRIADLLDVCLYSTCAFGDPADDDLTVWNRPIPKAARALADTYLGEES